MSSQHQEAAITQDSSSTTGGGAAMDRDILAQQAVLTDNDLGVLITVDEILWRTAQDRKGPHPGTRTDPRAALNNHMGVQFDPIAQHRAGADHTKRTDLNAAANPGAIFDDGRRMNPAHTASWPVTIMALITASATLSPLTIATPENFQIFFRFLSCCM